MMDRPSLGAPVEERLLHRIIGTVRPLQGSRASGSEGLSCEDVEDNWKDGGKGTYICDGICMILSDAGYVTGRTVGILFVSHGRKSRYQ
jgi:hypothetical protein